MKKRKFLSLIVLGLLLLLIPIQSAHAGVWDDILGAVKNIALLPLKISLVSCVVLMLYSLMQTGVFSFLIYVIVVLISRAMIVYSLNTPISPSSPSAMTSIGVIYDSWNFTLGFVNMFFALTLTFIGLATILGLKDYEAKILLPKLLKIAILVNFTPVIIGFIVDMGNLVTNFFVSKSDIRTDNVIEFVSDLWVIFESTLNLGAMGDFFLDLPVLILGPFSDVLGRSMELTGKIIIGIIFLFYSIYIYVCITGMFFLRTIMLWILTILSPIAFFSSIFPENSPFQRLFPGILGWKEWWDKFLQWVIVGIPFGLFLYISTAIFKAGSVIPAFGSYDLEGALFQGITIQPLLNSLTSLFTYSVSLMMLYQGYKISLAAAPEMARSMIKGTEKLIKMAAMAAATAGVGAAAGAAGSSLGGAASSLEGVATKYAGQTGVKGAFGKISKVASKGLRKAQVGTNQIATRSKPKTPKHSEDWGDKEWMTYAHSTTDKRSRASAFEKVKEWNKVDEKDKEWAGGELKAMTQQGYLTKEQGGTFKKMYDGGIGDDSPELFLALSGNTEKAEKQIGSQVQKLQEEIDKNKVLKAQIETTISSDPTKNREEYMRELAVKTLVLSNPKRKIKDKEEAVSLASKLTVTKKRLKEIEDSFGAETSSQLMDGPAGINARYDDVGKLTSEKPALASYLLSSMDGEMYGYEARMNAGKLGIENTKTNKVDMKMVYQKAKEYKVKEELKEENISIPDNIIIKTEDLNKKKATIEVELGLVGGTPAAVDSANYKKADKYAKTLGTNLSDTNFTDKFIQAEAKRQLLKDQESLRGESISAKKKEEFESEMPIFKSAKKKILERKLERTKEAGRIDSIDEKIRKVNERIQKKLLKKGSPSQLLSHDILTTNQMLEKDIQELNKATVQANKYEEILKKDLVAPIGKKMAPLSKTKTKGSLATSKLNIERKTKYIEEGRKKIEEQLKTLNITLKEIEVSTEKIEGLKQNYKKAHSQKELKLRIEEKDKSIKAIKEKLKAGNLDLENEKILIESIVTEMKN